MSARCNFRCWILSQNSHRMYRMNQFRCHKNHLCSLLCWSNLLSLSNLVDYNFGIGLQMALLSNALRPEMKSAAIQHILWQNIKVFVEKAGHIEAALSVLSFTKAACVDGDPSKLDNLDNSIQELLAKFDTLLKVVNCKTDIPQWQRAPWQSQPSKNPSFGTKFQSPPSPPWKVGIVCCQCGQQGHFQRECLNGQSSGPGGEDQLTDSSGPGLQMVSSENLSSSKVAI